MAILTHGRWDCPLAGGGIILPSLLTTMVSGPDGQPTARGLVNNETTVGDNNDNVSRRERAGVIVYAVDTNGWFSGPGSEP